MKIQQLFDKFNSLEHSYRSLTADMHRFKAQAKFRENQNIEAYALRLKLLEREIEQHFIAIIPSSSFSIAKRILEETANRDIRAYIKSIYKAVRRLLRVLNRPKRIIEIAHRLESIVRPVEVFESLNRQDIHKSFIMYNARVYCLIDALLQLHALQTSLT